MLALRRFEIVRVLAVEGLAFAPIVQELRQNLSIDLEPITELEPLTMADKTPHNDEIMSEDVAQNPGMRAAAVNADPTISLEETRAASAGEQPNAAGGPASSSAEDYVPSRSDPHPSNIPSTDHPLPDDADDETIGASQSFSEETDDKYVH